MTNVLEVKDLRTEFRMRHSTVGGLESAECPLRER
jgi:hypothetical protein